MRIREATEKDKAEWDAFINSIEANYSFGYYFDWKSLRQS